MVTARGFSDLFTFTRAAAGNFVDEQGLVQSAAANIPRFEYDLSGNFLGLLLEVVDDINTTDIDWFNTLEGTFFVEFDFVGAPFGTPVGLFAIDDDSSANGLELELSTGNEIRFVVRRSSTSDTIISGGTYPGGTVKVACAYKAADSAISLNGGAIVTDTGTVLPTGLTRLSLGIDVFDRKMIGHIKEFRYYPRRLTNEELVTLTTAAV